MEAREFVRQGLGAGAGLLQAGFGQAPGDAAGDAEDSLQEAFVLEVAVRVGYDADIEAPTRALGRTGGSVTFSDGREQLTRSIGHPFKLLRARALNTPTNGWRVSATVARSARQ